MKVKILYSYIVSVVPPRCRNPRNERRHDGELEVEIREVPVSQAPVALQVTNSTMRSRRGETVTSKDKIDYRWFDGCLWTNCNMFGCSRRGFTSGKSDWNYPRPSAVLDLRSKDSVLAGNSRLGISIDLYHSKEEIESRLRRWASGWLILEGQRGIWATAREPRYVAMTFGLGCNHGGSALMLDDGYNSNISKSRYFSALQFNEAKAEATKLAKERGDTQSLPIRPHGRIKVLLPEAVLCRPSVEAGEGSAFINQMNELSKLQSPVMAAVLGIASLGAMSSL